MKILYLVPNLSDPAVARRLAMFRLGGAEVEVAGFRRADAPETALAANAVVQLDVTHDARMVHRLLVTARARYSSAAWMRVLSQPDVIVARNLEMLAIAERLLEHWDRAPALVYECLDIHRLMLRGDGIGRAMRGFERRLMRKARLLLTSSPAFLANHFNGADVPPAVLVENKVFSPDEEGSGRNPVFGGDATPLRIGWFGALRCSKSLEALSGLAGAMNGQVEVTLRGRPALTEFSDFHGSVAAAPHLSYAGTYRYPDDLVAIYSAVQFVWAIDFFEEGQNSDWLLPNRLYEGCLNGAIPIALAGTETAAFIERLGIGIVIPDIAVSTLTALFSAMTPDRVLALAEAVARQDKALFRCGKPECVRLVETLSSLTETAERMAA